MAKLVKLITKSEFFRAIMDHIVIETNVGVEHMAEYRHYTGKLFRKAMWVRIRSIPGMPATAVPALEITFGVWNGGLVQSAVIPVECRVQVTSKLNDILRAHIVHWPEDGPIVDLRELLWKEVCHISSVPGVEHQDLFAFLDCTHGWMLMFEGDMVELHLDDVKDNNVNGRIRFDQVTNDVYTD